jgi:hypothetical protein
MTNKTIARVLMIISLILLGMCVVIGSVFYGFYALMCVAMSTIVYRRVR